MLCACGCNQTTSIAKVTNRRFGHVKGQHVRYRSGHSRRKLEPEYVINTGTGCWEWLGEIDHKGYARYGRAWCLRNGRKRVHSHRVYHEDFNGPIPDGYQVDHLCFVRHCVNPARLEAVTPAENNRRKVARYWRMKQRS